MLKPMRPFAAGELCAMSVLQSPTGAAERRASDTASNGELATLMTQLSGALLKSNVEHPLLQSMLGAT